MAPTRARLDRVLNAWRRKPLAKAPWRAAAAGVAGLLALALVTSQTLAPYDALREQTFDAMLSRLIAAPSTREIAIVDIDRVSLERLGAWPWGRDEIARLVERIAARKPTAIGIDILIDGPDERSPAALARRLADLTGSAEARALAANGTLVDGDARLAAILEGIPVVLGLVLDTERGSERLPTPPVLMQGGSDLSAIWQAGGVAGPPRAVAEAATGLGVIALAGDSDGRVRRVPLLAAGDGQLRPGLALEMVRVTSKASAYVLARGNLLRIADRIMPIGPDAALRLVPLDTAAMSARTISAAALDTAMAADLIAGRIVLVGSSAPELGGLRLASGGALVPSVQLQAEAVAQLTGGLSPRRPPALDWLEPAALAVSAALALLLGLLLNPKRAILATAGLSISWLALSATVLRGGGVLLDPIAVPTLAMSAVLLTALLVEAATRRREAALRRRFEQHLAPELVSRLVENPELLKLAGETREVTILFTDVEGFTSMTERSDPATLIRVLDRYIDEMSAIIVAHGGMVEKIVGDGFHGLFNAPLDLDKHADKAVACARAIRKFSEDFAADDEPRSLGFGRTRVGIETGPVTVGDVGGGTRLDYTAYGNAMNTAARLEAANKDLASAICIGPNTAAALTDTSDLRPLGRLAVRGRSDTMQIYDLFPETIPATERDRWRDAMRLAATSPETAADALAALAKEGGPDPVRDTLIATLKG